MLTSRLLAVGAALVAAVAFAAPAPAKPVLDREDFVTPYERDVYEIVVSTLRNPTDATSPDANLFNDAGVALGFTWGQFSAARATSLAQHRGAGKRTETDVQLQLTGLVPGGLYSLFYITIGPDSENPLCPGVERSLPLTAYRPSSTQPDAASFYASATGTASFHARVPGALLNAQQLIYSVIYHAFGGPYGSLPNALEFQTQGPNCRSSFGYDSMRQLLVTQKFS